MVVTAQAVVMANRVDEQYRASRSVADLGLVMAGMVETAEARAVVATGETAATPVS
ncbi:MULTISPECIES: hypothetical protein [Bradyrhizobium]|uniref:hypothetical protein n=1 Tax=Bradyrhizobium TaxID=374 RepID=UPI0013752B33|nr:MULTISPECIES: hypothetical protein [Bradyrhizobium]MCD9824577.1 hypothetical protein [Bradyrhizobium japonicum]MCD9897412.1 hypothetical protein [Bradyrhizobium japonicum]MEB2671154.1 hypothetical protein [Bradyrhizobium japonicum]WLB28606.1 hypothetical protein QIH85_43705 [Bradyrhizobium japonicum]WRI90478.1 hypothetical protein R3F75_05855 [Bradyrhizobium japonicum]